MPQCSVGDRGLQYLHSASLYYYVPLHLGLHPAFLTSLKHVLSMQFDLLLSLHHDGSPHIRSPELGSDQSALFMP
jgi:hypothetical protein